MFENKQKKMISRILAHHGFKNQLIKTVEELSELTTAIVQYYNKGPGESRLRGVQEEIADVYIMLCMWNISSPFSKNKIRNSRERPPRGGFFMQKWRAYEY